jgi:hypothetical protein
MSHFLYYLTVWFQCVIYNGTNVLYEQYSTVQYRMKSDCMKRIQRLWCKFLDATLPNIRTIYIIINKIKGTQWARWKAKMLSAHFEKLYETCAMLEHSSKKSLTPSIRNRGLKLLENPWNWGHIKRSQMAYNALLYFLTSVNWCHGW